MYDGAVSRYDLLSARYNPPYHPAPSATTASAHTPHHTHKPRPQPSPAQPSPLCELLLLRPVLRFPVGPGVTCATSYVEPTCATCRGPPPPTLLGKGGTCYGSAPTPHAVTTTDTTTLSHSHLLSAYILSFSFPSHRQLWHHQSLWPRPCQPPFCDYAGRLPALIVRVASTFQCWPRGVCSSDSSHLHHAPKACWPVTQQSRRITFIDPRPLAFFACEKQQCGTAPSLCYSTILSLFDFRSSSRLSSLLVLSSPNPQSHTHLRERYRPRTTSRPSSSANPYYPQILLRILHNELSQGPRGRPHPGGPLCPG
jgi:hypothetical protein